MFLDYYLYQISTEYSDPAEAHHNLTREGQTGGARSPAVSRRDPPASSGFTPLTVHLLSASRRPHPSSASRRTRGRVHRVSRVPFHDTRGHGPQELFPRRLAEGTNPGRFRYHTYIQGASSPHPQTPQAEPYSQAGSRQANEQAEKPTRNPKRTNRNPPRARQRRRRRHDDGVPCVHPPPL